MTFRWKLHHVDQCEPIGPGALGYQILRGIYKAAPEAAALATKLQYIDAEAKSRVKLDKITTQRKLEMAQGKMQVLDKEFGYFGLGSKFPDYDQTRDSITSLYFWNQMRCAVTV